MSIGGCFVSFVDENFGKLAYFMVYAVLEWIMIILLFIDGLLALISYEFAKFFDLRIPCLLCTRIDHVFFHRNSDFYYNESICEIHKKDISSLAYCHAHEKLSDIRSMCQGCLLSFATQKDSEFEKHKSVVGIVQRDVNWFVEDDDTKLLVKGLRRDDVMIERFSDEINGVFPRCSCCGEFLNSKSNSKYIRSLSVHAPSPSPRAPFPSAGNKNEELNIELPDIRYTQVELMSDTESDHQEDGDGPIIAVNHGRDDAKSASVLPDSEISSEFAPSTPNFGRINKFFGIPLSDSTQASPRFSSKLGNNDSYNKKPSALDKSDSFFTEDDNTTTTNLLIDTEGDILTHLKRQVRSAQKSLMDLYTELDEERSASAVAANNAMAMITRLQAEKAAVQMEALQYQRMMDEQAEYDQEAIQVLKDLLYKREEDVRALESELDVYRERYGLNKKIGSGICEIDAEDYQDMKGSSGARSSFGEKSDCWISIGAADVITDNEYGSESFDDVSPFDFEHERSHLLDLLKGLEEKINAPSSEKYDSFESNTTGHEETTGNESKGMLTREVSFIRQRLRAIEAESGFLKHAAMTLQRGEKGTQLLIEIAQRLRNLRQPIKSLAEDTEA